MNKVQMVPEQEIKNYDGVDFYNFWRYGHELEKRRRQGWYIGHLVFLADGECSILWERLK